MTFGFTVHYYDYTRSGSSLTGWAVSLPHQCDDWEIADDGWPGIAPQDVAVQRLEAFIAEAQEALKHLRAGENWSSRP